jgi:hypothetical protein
MEVVLVIAVAVLTVIPLFKLLPRFGINALWSLAAVVPLGGVILLWVMAARVDRLDRPAATEDR